MDRVCTIIAINSIKSHLELQREIALTELGPSSYFFIGNSCLVDMNMFARFDKIPTMTFQDIKQTKHYGRTHACTHERTHGQLENSISRNHNLRWV